MGSAKALERGKESSSIWMRRFPGICIIGSALKFVPEMPEWQTESTEGDPTPLDYSIRHPTGQTSQATISKDLPKGESAEITGGGYHIVPVHGRRKEDRHEFKFQYFRT